LLSLRHDSVGGDCNNRRTSALYEFDFAIRFHGIEKNNIALTIQWKGVPIDYLRRHSHRLNQSLFYLICASVNPARKEISRTIEAKVTGAVLTDPGFRWKGNFPKRIIGIA
jgi:hypothetical protein